MSKRAVAPVPIPPFDPITITKKTSKKFKKLVSNLMRGLVVNW